MSKPVKAKYEAPEIIAITIVGERGYASSAFNTSLTLVPPAGAGENGASSYEQVDWTW